MIWGAVVFLRTHGTGDESLYCAETEKLPVCACSAGAHSAEITEPSPCLQPFLEFTSSGKFHRDQRKACAGATTLASLREKKGLESTAGLSSLSTSSRSCRPKQQPRSQADVSDKVCVTRGGGVTPGGGRKEALFPGKPIFRLRLERLRHHLHKCRRRKARPRGSASPSEFLAGSSVPRRARGGRELLLLAAKAAFGSSAPLDCCT